MSFFLFLFVLVQLTVLVSPVWSSNEEYTCNIVTYRDHADSTGFWIVREEAGTRLTLHVGTSKGWQRGDRFDEIHMKVHGRLRSGYARHLRSVGDWVAAMKHAQRECQEWKMRNRRPPDSPPPSGTLAPPALSEMVVEMKHQARGTAGLRVAVRADYQDIGRFGPKQILLTLRIIHQSGRMILTREFCPLSASELRVQGNSLILTLTPELTEPGDYTIRATLLDSRLSSTAHGRLAYEDNLRVPITIYRPVAEIMHATGMVSIKRKDSKTASGGIKVQAGGRIIPGSDTDTLQPGPVPVSPWREDPFAQSPGIACNRFLYEGDQVNLFGIAESPAFDSSRRLSQDIDNSFAGIKKSLSSGRSSIDLEWPGGVSGRAVWLPALSAYTSHGRFVIGATREASGKWRSKWSDLFSQGAYFLFEQSVDYVKDKAILWFLNVNLGGVSSFITALNLSTGGGEEWDELFYLRLNSEVILSAAKDRLDIYTFAGNPELIQHKTGKRMLIPQGKMIRASASSITAPQQFKPGEVVPLLTASEDRPEPLDLDLASSIMNSLTRKLSPEIPQLQANVISVRFFESGQETVLPNQRIYAIRFPVQSTRFICWELNLDYPSPSQRIDFQVEAFLYRQDGSLISRQVHNCFIQPGWTRSHHFKGFGSQNPGSWAPGTYRVDLFMFEKKISSHTFEIAGR